MLMRTEEEQKRMTEEAAENWTTTREMLWTLKSNGHYIRGEDDLDRVRFLCNLLAKINNSWWLKLIVFNRKGYFRGTPKSI